MTYQL